MTTCSADLISGENGGKSDRAEKDGEKYQETRQAKIFVGCMLLFIVAMSGLFPCVLLFMKNNKRRSP